MKIKDEFRIRPSYSQTFKRRVVKEILIGKYTKQESSVLYRVNFKSIDRWLNNLGQSVILDEGIETITLKKYNILSKKNKITESDQIRELRKQIKQLEKEKSDAELKAKLYDKMIDIAEEQFKIPIRKKYVTRQSPNSKNKK